jgi:large subunit ribosomal protein L27
MSKTKAAGTTRLGRDSLSKRLGVKLFAGQIAKPGSIIVRQRGSKFLAGKNVRRGNDDTLYAIRNGVVKFTNKAKTKFDGNKRIAKVVNVI